MKIKLKSFVFIILAVLVAMPVFVKTAKASMPTLSVSPPSQVVQVGSSFSVDVNLDYAENLYGYEIRLSFDSSKINATSVEYRGYLNTPIYNWPLIIDNAAGYIDYAISNHQPAVSKTGGSPPPLVTVHFKAIAIGTSALHLVESRTILVSALNEGAPIPHQTVDGKVNIAPLSTVSVDPIIQTVRIGQQFSIDINLDNALNLYGYEVRLTFDPVELTATGVEYKNYLNGPTNTWHNEINNTGGYVDFAVSSLYPASAKTGGSPPPLITLHLEAIALGTHSLHLDSGKTWLVNNETQTLPIQTVDGTVIVQPPGEAPLITVLSPENKTYYTAAVPLMFNINEPTSWIGYSLDNQANVTISGGTTIICDVGTHSIVMYANDTEGNMGKSDIVCFTTIVQPVIYDIAVTKIEPSKTIIGEGHLMIITVTVQNLGDYDSDSFDVILYANQTVIGTQTNVVLSKDESLRLTFMWSTTGFKKYYIINATATPVPGETNLANNSLKFAGSIIVSIPGDINGDFVVDISDAALLGLNWQKTVPPAPANVDISGDGIIDISDAAVIGINWQKDP